MRVSLTANKFAANEERNLRAQVGNQSSHRKPNICPTCAHRFRSSLRRIYSLYNPPVHSGIPLPLSAAWEEIWANAAEKTGVVGEAHLLLGILDAQDEMVTALLMLSGVSSEETKLYAQSWLDNGPATAEQKIEFARSASRVLLLASREAGRDKSPFIEPHHFFIACVSHRRGAHLGQVLRPIGLDTAQIRAHLRRIRASQKPYPRGHPLNDLSESAKAVLERAHAEMRASFCGRISAAHLLLGLLSDVQTADRLEKAGCDFEDLRKRARDSIKNDGEIASPQKRFSPGAKRALERAANAAKLAGRKRIDCGDLLIGLLPGSETPGERWRARGRGLDSIEDLWTAEQVAALRRELNSEATEEIVEVAARPASKLLWWLERVPYTLGFAGSAYLFHIPQNRRSETFFVVLTMSLFGAILVSGIGTCVTIMLKSASHIKEAWLNFFARTVFGMFVGYYLLKLV